MKIEIIEADFESEKQGRDIVYLTNMYSEDTMGGEEPLTPEVKHTLISKLKKMPTAVSFLAYDEDKPIGIANCFIGFSTFEARTLINVHDLAVVPEVRGRGIGERLLQAVQKKAKELKCCKITLEVRDDNPAKDFYERFGFENDDPKMWFMTKELF